MITSILNGSINNVKFDIEPFFGLHIPLELEGVETKILNPVNSWNNKEEYSNDARKLMKLFKRNFVSYGQEVEYLVQSGPK